MSAAAHDARTQQQMIVRLDPLLLQRLTVGELAAVLGKQAQQVVRRLYERERERPPEKK